MTSRQKRRWRPGSGRCAAATRPASQSSSGNGPHQRAKGAGQSELVCAGEGLGGEQARQAVQRSRQPAMGPSTRAPSAGLDHGHLAGPVNVVGDADAPVEADEIGAAAEEHVLAVVDDLVDAGMQIGAGAAAEVAAPFDEVHAESGFGKSAGRAHAGHAAADDDHGFFRASASNRVVPLAV